MKKYFSTFLLSILLVANAFAEIKLPAIVSSNMILQRDANVVIWGWSDEKEVKLSFSWVDQEQKIKVDKNGKWMTKVATTLSKDAQEVVIQDNSSSITLTNILFGEVWLCSGQSNMEMQVKGFWGQPAYGTLEAQLQANNAQIRMFRLWNHGSKEPLDNPVNYVGWTEADAEQILNWTAVGYYFGKGLHEYLDVPIGLISASRGASSVQTWMSEEVLGEFEEVDLSDVEFTPQTNQKVPTVFFNGMINPLIPYTIKGALWYQGEANRAEPNEYTRLFPAMVKDWRDRWGQGDFPIYFVQIAPFRYGGNKGYEVRNNVAFMREAQLKCVDIIPNSGIAITLDLGKEDYIHPPKKKEVGERLLYHALSKTYGAKGIDCESPTFKSMEEQNGGLLLSFNNAELGVYAFDGLQNFEIAGADKVFYPAEAKIKNAQFVLVKSPKVEKPVAVRYAWDNWVMGTLYDTNLLPASSFRTDDWDDATRAPKE